jgi:hypothetical protein
MVKSGSSLVRDEDALLQLATYEHLRERCQPPSQHDSDEIFEVLGNKTFVLELYNTMKFSAGVVLTLLVSPASTFVQRPSLVFQTHRPTFRQTSNHRSSQLQAVEIANVFTGIAADPEVATAAANSLGLLDVAVFLVPLTALAAGASAISQRDLIRSEIDTTERTLAETKALLEKSDQTIKVRNE